MSNLLALVFFLALTLPTWAQFVAVNEGEFLTHSTNIPRFGTPIVTGPDGAIYVCYVDTALDTRIARKDPTTGLWTETVLETNTQADQFHNQCSIGLDVNGFIHVAYNMHGTPWQYKRSNSANSIAAFTFLGQDAGTIPGKSVPADGNCTGQCETDWLTDEPGIAAIPGNQISYPHFANDNAGALYIGYRECLDCDADFFSRQWSIGLAKYNATAQTWSRVGGVRPFATGAVRLPIGFRMYGDSLGRLHASWVWCDHYTPAGTVPLAGGQACFAASNHVTYAYSDDGITWRQANGTAMTLPLNHDETEVAVPASWFVPGSVGYFDGHTGMTAAGPSGQPFVVVHPNAGNQPAFGIARGYVRYTGTAWTFPPVKIDFSPSIFYEDATGSWTAVSSGLRIHRSTNQGSSWTVTLLDSARGSYDISFDRKYLQETNKLRIYANRGASGLLVIWTVSWPQRPFYVATTGNDANDCLSPTTACATIQRAHDIAECGNVINVLPGQYYQRPTLTKVCTASAPLVIQGFRGIGATWDSKIEGTDSTSGWTDATAQCAGCWRIANPGYIPQALTAHTNRLTVMRLSDSLMGGTVCSGCLANGFTTLARAAAATCSRSVGTVNCWDGIEAFFGVTGGFTYVKFRNAEDANTMSIRVAPSGGTFKVSGAQYITLQHLQIAGGQYGVWITDGSDHITVRENDMRNGVNGVRVETGCDDTVIRRNVLSPRFIGSTAGYAATPYRPMDWNSSSTERQVANNIYNFNKFEVGNTTEGMAPIDLRSGGARTQVLDNVISDVVVGVNILSTPGGVTLRGNTMHHCAAECVWAVDRNQSITVDANLFYEGDHLIRVQLMGWDKSLVIIRNRFYQEGEAAKHIHFSFSSDIGAGETDSPAVIWVAQNTFAGSGWAVDLGLAGGAETVPCVRLVNNMISVAGAAGTRGLSSTGYGSTRLGLYAYNSIQETGSGVTGFISGQGCIGALEGNITAGAAIWTTPPMPSFVLPGGHAGLDTGLNLAVPFTLNGVIYPALVPISYYGDTADRGAMQQGAPIRIAARLPRKVAVPEVCGDRLDNDYNGTVDNGC